VCVCVCVFVCVCVCVCVYVAMTVNIHRSTAPRAYGVTNRVMRLEGSTVCDPLSINYPFTVFCEITFLTGLFLVPSADRNTR